MSNDTNLKKILKIKFLNMTIKELNNFITENNILPGDVIVVNKSIIPIDHYLVYMGKDTNNSNWFMANLKSKGGVSWLSEQEVSSKSNGMHPDRIRRFKKNKIERKEALERAKSNLGESYDLITNNCEHFANEVQFNKKSNRQVTVFKIAAAVLLALGIGNILKNE